MIRAILLLCLLSFPASAQNACDMLAGEPWSYCVMQTVENPDGTIDAPRSLNLIASCAHKYVYFALWRGADCTASDIRNAKPGSRCSVDNEMGFFMNAVIQCRPALGN